MSEPWQEKVGRFLRAILCCFLALCMSACATWAPVEKERLATALERQPYRLRVASQGSRYELAKPRLAGDTLRGRVDERDTALPLSSVDSLWIRQNNRNTTRFVAITTLVIATAFVVAASLNKEYVASP